MNVNDITDAQFELSMSLHAIRTHAAQQGLNPDQILEMLRKHITLEEDLNGTRQSFERTYR